MQFPLHPPAGIETRSHCRRPGPSLLGLQSSQIYQRNSQQLQLSNKGAAASAATVLPSRPEASRTRRLTLICLRSLHLLARRNDIFAGTGNRDGVARYHSAVPV